MTPRRGDVVLVDLSVPVGHLAGYERPAVVVSHDRLAVAGHLDVIALVAVESRLRTNLVL